MARVMSCTGNETSIAPRVPPKTMTAAVNWTIWPTWPPSMSCPPRMAPTPSRVPRTLAISSTLSPPSSVSLGCRGFLRQPLPVVHREPDHLVDLLKHHELFPREESDQSVGGGLDHLDQVAVQRELAPVQPFQSDHVRSIMEATCVRQAPHSSTCAATAPSASPRREPFVLARPWSTPPADSWSW